MIALSFAGSGSGAVNIIGLMSGTSLDGVDAVLIEVTGSGRNTSYKRLGFHSVPYPAELKQALKRNSLPGGGNTEEICKLNFVLPHIYAEAVSGLLQLCGKDKPEITVIGSHGQTIYHSPAKELFCGYPSQSTLQIGDPSVLAKLTGIPVAGNFRPGDIALGGQGAPLVPLIDYLLFSPETGVRVLLNIGGISNITVLTADSTPEKVPGYDCGPGNILIDLCAQALFNNEYDSQGLFAAQGKCNAELLQSLIDADSYLTKPAPKSTGREYYEAVIYPVIQSRFSALTAHDIMATVTHYTAYCIFHQYTLWSGVKSLPNQIFISGGGSYNVTLVNELKKLFGNSVSIENSSVLGIDPQEKEAICFALLANECINGNPGNLPGVTGAKQPTQLGVLCLP